MGVSVPKSFLQYQAAPAEEYPDPYDLLMEPLTKRLEAAEQGVETQALKRQAREQELQRLMQAGGRTSSNTLAPTTATAAAAVPASQAEQLHSPAPQPKALTPAPNELLQQTAHALVAALMSVIQSVPTSHAAAPRVSSSAPPAEQPMTLHLTGSSSSYLPPAASNGVPFLGEVTPEWQVANVEREDQTSTGIPYAVNAHPSTGVSVLTPSGQLAMGKCIFDPCATLTLITEAFSDQCGYETEPATMQFNQASCPQVKAALQVKGGITFVFAAGTACERVVSHVPAALVKQINNITTQGNIIIHKGTF
jgi:hypothetical protein